MNEKDIHPRARRNSSGTGSLRESFPDEPTEEERRTLRRVSGKIPWQAYTISFVELCERFSWYGTTAVFVNFIQQPLPPGSTTGAITPGYEVPGALGRGQQASTGLTTFNQFWAYVMPLVGGWVADQYLGRYRTIQYSIAFAIVGHIILVVASIPSVIQNPNGSMGCFAVGLVILGMGTGGFKSNISPLLAEQIPTGRMQVITLPKTGERVIRDPAVTVSRVFLYFYMMINIGSLLGGIAMVYAERGVGFWLAFALPTFLFFVCPIVLWSCKSRYVHMPPTGSVLAKSLKLVSLASKGKFSANPMRTYRNFTSGDFWNDVKPSRLGNAQPAWMHDIDDAWVDQVRRGYSACKVFLWYPLYWLAYNQMVGNLTSQSATLRLGGVPNDLINNLNPLSLIIFIPLMDFLVYPALRRARIRFTPLKRITAGFFIACASMVAATVVQVYVYRTHPCGSNAQECPDQHSPISVWVQTVPYVLIGFSEIFASITGLEYAFTKAPENMRSIVMAIFLFQSALAAALGNALLPLVADPLLVWNYAVTAILAFLGGVGFWLTWYKLDAREDELNMLAKSNFVGRKGGGVNDEA